VFSSDVHVRNVSGEQSIKTFSGDLPLTLNEQRRGRLRADLNEGDPNLPARYPAQIAVLARLLPPRFATLPCSSDRAA